MPKSGEKFQSVPAMVKRLFFLFFPQISQISADDKNSICENQRDQREILLF
jgi:hypothetical protein